MNKGASRIGDRGFVKLEALADGGRGFGMTAKSSDFDPAALASNTFEMEWPPRSGNRQEFPEVDRAEWFGPEAAREKILAAQAELLDRLLERIRS